MSPEPTRLVYSTTRVLTWAAAARASWLADLLEEGYADTEALLKERTDAVDCLQRFLSGALRVLGTPPERERFYLMREPVGAWIPSADKAFAGASETVCTTTSIV